MDDNVIFQNSNTDWFMKILSFFNSTNNKIIATLIIIGVLLVIIEIISLWHIFNKAGKKGFASIIPVYNIMCLLNISNQPGYYLILLFIPIINLFPIYNISMGLARVFQKKPSFGWGLVLLNPIFMLKLAFDDSGYDKDYYYTSVDATPVTNIASKSGIDDYNQGLIFDPKDNVDDVVASAPLDPYINGQVIGEENDMSYFGMSDKAANNIIQGGDVLVNNTLNNNEPVQTSTIPEPVIPFKATTNQTVVDAPVKMSLEQLLGGAKAESSSNENAPLEKEVTNNSVQTSSINPDIILGVSPVTTPDNSSFIENISNNDAVISQPQSTNNDNLNDLINIASTDIDMPASNSAGLEELIPVDKVDESTNENINQDFIDNSISSILGIDPNSLEAVPIEPVKEQPTATEPIIEELQREEPPAVINNELVQNNQNSNNNPEIDINSLLGLGDIAPVPVIKKEEITSEQLPIENNTSSESNPLSVTTSNVIPEVVPVPSPVTIKEVTDISNTAPAVVNNATTIAETTPILTPVSPSNNFDLNNFLNSNGFDTTKTESENTVELGKIESYVGQPNPTIIPPNPDKDIFIPHEEEKKAPVDKVCPNCGAKIPPESKFCNLCGKAV